MSKGKEPKDPNEIIKEKFTKITKNDFGACFGAALTCTTIEPVVTDDAVTGYQRKFSAGHLIGNILFFTAGMAAGDAIPNMIKSKKKGA